MLMKTFTAMAYGKSNIMCKNEKATSVGQLTAHFFPKSQNFHGPKASKAFLNAYFKIILLEPWF